MTRRFDIAHAALLDMGRPDLADLLVEHNGHPFFHPKADGTLPLADCKLGARAFRLGHLGDPEGVPIECHSADEILDHDVFPACDPGTICPTIGRHHWPQTWRDE